MQDFHNRNKWLQSLSNFFFSVGDRFERAFKLNIHPYLNFVEGHQMKLAYTVQYVGYQRKWMNTGILLTRVRTHALNIDKTNSACASAITESTMTRLLFIGILIWEHPNTNTGRENERCFGNFQSKSHNMSWHVTRPWHLSASCLLRTVCIKSPGEINKFKVNFSISLASKTKRKLQKVWNASSYSRLYTTDGIAILIVFNSSFQVTHTTHLTKIIIY